MIRLLLLTLGGFIIYSLISGLLRPKKKQPPANRSAAGETMVEDPQCKTFLPESEAIKATINGREYFFCSKKCLKEFKHTLK
jgi:YHS domain-containing protein